MSVSSPRTRPLPADFQVAVERAYGYRIVRSQPLNGGFEAAVYRVECEDRSRVLRIGQLWRRAEELQESYSFAAHAAQGMLEVPAPCQTLGGAFVTQHSNRPISLWPFIEGRSVDPTNEAECGAAALTLARLHRELASAPVSQRSARAQPRDPRLDGTNSDELDDDELDQWLIDHLVRPSALGAVHGDYWFNNLIFDGDKIVGIVDWDDARTASLERELACAVWDFCSDPLRSVLDRHRAERFLEIYTFNEGPASVADRTFIVPFIRDYIRSEVRRALLMGGTVEGRSLDNEIRAFWDLREQSLSTSRPKHLRSGEPLSGSCFSNLTVPRVDELNLSGRMRGLFGTGSLMTSPLESDNSGLSTSLVSEDAARQVLDHGYAQLLASPTIQGQITAAFELGLAFFRSDAADKASNTLPNQTGYRPFGIEYSQSSARPDQIESFSVCRALRDTGHASLTTPARALHDGLLQLFDTVEPLAEALIVKVAERLTGRSYGATFRGGLRHYSLLQMNYSLPKSATVGYINETHEDGSLVTFTSVTAPGLEIQTADGAFLPVVPSAARMLVMPGEILSLLTGRRILPMLHRVLPIR